jgi:hypothetical protein
VCIGDALALALLGCSSKGPPGVPLPASHWDDPAWRRDAGTALDQWILRGAPDSPSTRMVAWASHLFMEGMVLAEREGKSAKFRIPKSLKNTIDPRF